MKDYIEREAALNFETKITAAPSEIQAISQGMSLYAEHIKAIPAADVVPVVRGRWELITRGETGYSAGDFRCSVCRRPCKCWALTDYCPNCGAKMNGGETDAVD